MKKTVTFIEVRIPKAHGNEVFVRELEAELNDHEPINADEIEVYIEQDDEDGESFVVASFYYAENQMQQIFEDYEFLVNYCEEVMWQAFEVSMKSKQADRA